MKQAIARLRCPICHTYMGTAGNTTLCHCDLEALHKIPPSETQENFMVKLYDQIRYVFERDYHGCYHMSKTYTGANNLAGYWFSLGSFDFGKKGRV
jgi:hypothetical protein